MSDEKSKLFRESSLERISSPEQLDDYIKVSNPGLWMFMAAIIVLLGSVIVWGIFGTIETTIDTTGALYNGSVYCFFSEETIESVYMGQKVKLGDTQSVVESVSDEPVSYDEIARMFSSSSYILDSLGVTSGDWRYVAIIDAADIKSSVTPVSIVTDTLNPISFVLNT